PAQPFRATGLLLAAVSGALAPGVGYAIWATAVPHLTATRAAVAQLLVPVLAAGGGIALLGEHLTSRLLASAACILCGVALALFSASAALCAPTTLYPARRSNSVATWRTIASSSATSTASLPMSGRPSVASRAAAARCPVAGR